MGNMPFSPLTACVITLTGTWALAADPAIKRENIEWLDVWVPDVNAEGLPRVLLVGDSITRGYGPQVAERLKGKAYVARLATSKSLGDPALLAEVGLLLGQYRFDVIHFNNGLHGWGYSEDEYRAAFPELLALLKRQGQGARLIWATTTPVRVSEKLEEFAPRTERVKARNAIAHEIVATAGIPVDDLYALVVDHPEYYGKDGTHFNAKGTAAQAAQVADRVLEVSKKATP